MKPKKITRLSKLTSELKRILEETYKFGYDLHTIQFKDLKSNTFQLAVPLETNDFYYLVVLDNFKKATNNAQIEEEDDMEDMDDVQENSYDDVEEEDDSMDD